MEEYVGWSNRCANGETDRDDWIICKIKTKGEPVICPYSDISDGKIQEDCPDFKKRFDMR